MARRRFIHPYAFRWRSRYGVTHLSHNPPVCWTRVRLACQRRHYRSRTAASDVYWTKQYVHSHGKRHTLAMGRAALETFLNPLVTTRRVSASTPSQALNALVILYRQVLGGDPGWLEGLNRVKRRTRVPVVLTQDEVQRVLGYMKGTPEGRDTTH